MLAELLWSARALEDLMEIYVTMGLENVDAAERIFTALEARAGLLPSFPRMGLRRPEVAPTARVVVEGFYLILYELHPDAEDGDIDRVEVVRVVDGRRELRGMF